MRLRLRRRCEIILTVVLLLVLGSILVVKQTNVPTIPTTIAILTTETRQPFVNLDPTVLLDSWTLTTLSNHLYALSIGAQYIYYKIEAPVSKENKQPRVRYRTDLKGYCEHRTYGWRTAHFCKMPFVWRFMKTNRNVEKIVYLDSDAMFRHPDIHVNRHLDLLSPERPFGILTNRPWSEGICSGYWFLYRPIKNSLYNVEDFILEWWNEDWADTLFQWYDQSTIRRMVGGNFAGAQVGPKRSHTYINQTVIVDEWSFELKSPDQMILHIGHTIPDRDQQLAAAWPWGSEYPLDDRRKLAELLEQVDIRHELAESITSAMPLPGERYFIPPPSITSETVDN